MSHATPILEEVADHRPDAYQEGARLVVRASSLGGCLRALVASRMGMQPVDPGETAKRAMAEGVIHEPHVLRHLTSLGWDITDAQREVELSIAGGLVVIRGHLDGIGSSPAGERRVVEAKALGRDRFTRWQHDGFSAPEFRTYAYQLSVYMAATGLPGLFAVKNRDTGEVDIALVDVSPIPPAELKARAIRVLRATALPACDPVRWGCGFFYLHEQKDPEAAGNEEPIAEPALIEALDELARVYDQSREEEARAQAKRREVSVRLLDVLDGRKKVETPRYRVTEVSRTDRRVDLKKLRAEHPDLASQFETTSTTRYPKVTSLTGGTEAES